MGGDGWELGVACGEEYDKVGKSEGKGMTMLKGLLGLLALMVAGMVFLGANYDGPCDTYYQVDEDGNDVLDGNGNRIQITDCGDPADETPPEGSSDYCGMAGNGDTWVSMIRGDDGVCRVSDAVHDEALSTGTARSRMGSGYVPTAQEIAIDLYNLSTNEGGTGSSSDGCIDVHNKEQQDGRPYNQFCVPPDDVDYYLDKGYELGVPSN